MLDGVVLDQGWDGWHGGGAVSVQPGVAGMVVRSGGSGVESVEGEGCFLATHAEVDHAKRPEITPVLSDESVVIFPFGSVGQEGMGGHAHNDGLSLLVWGAGGHILVDPGNFLYTSNLESRQQYRSTSSHNTLILRSMEQNPIWPHRPFFLPDTASVSLLEQHIPSARAGDKRWDRTGVEVGGRNGRREWPGGDGGGEHSDSKLGLLDVARFSGEHVGYLERVGVVHRRVVHLAQASGGVLITDILDGSGVYPVELVFRFPPFRKGRPCQFRTPCCLSSLSLLLAHLNRRQEWIGPTQLAVDASVGDWEGEMALLPATPFTLKPLLESCWHAPTYGVRVPASQVVYRGVVRLPWQVTFLLVFRESNDLRR